MTDLKTWYVGKGKVTDEDVAAEWGVEIGADEWQFSDGPVGERGSSQDFPTLEAGITALSPCIIIMEYNMISPLKEYNRVQIMDHAIFCQLMKPVKDWLAAGAPHKKGCGFNMRFAHGEGEYDYDGKHCGTAMCIGGAINQFNALKIEEYVSGDVPILNEIVSKFNSISANIDDLFYPNKIIDYRYNLMEITPAMALQAIKNFETHGNANWKNIYP